MNRVVRTLIRRYQKWAFHSRSNKLALETLKGIESVKGKTDNKLIKLSDEYASEIFGGKVYAPWLYVYSAVNKKFLEGWIPDNFYGENVVPTLKGNYGVISDYNSLTTRLFTTSYFPVVLHYTNGLWISPNYEIIMENKVLDTIFKDCDKLVYKIDNSRKGKGIHFFEKNDFKVEKLKKLGNGVLQKYISQHSFFKAIVPNSVSTLRITSFINDQGKVSIRACYLRVGRSSDSHVRSASHIRIPVDIYTGSLGSGYGTDWIQIESHPDTKFIFRNKKIPEFNECVETVKKLHKMVPYTRTVGWDLIVDANNKVQVMEWNGGHNDIKFSEATQGPCFSDLGWEKLRKKS